MKLVLTPLIQRAIALGLAAIVLLVLFNAIVSPLWSSSALHVEQVAMLKRQALTMESLADAAPRYEALSKRLGADSQAQLLTFAAPQPTLAVAQLQGQLSQILATASATVTTSQPMPESKIGSLTKISVQTTMEGEVKALVAALHAIAAARPLLQVEKLLVRDPDGEWANPPQVNAPNKLQIELIVSAYMRAP